jgi:hypothetical protein
MTCSSNSSTSSSSCSTGAVLRCVQSRRFFLAAACLPLLRAAILSMPVTYLFECASGEAAKHVAAVCPVTRARVRLTEACSPLPWLLSS